MSKLADSIKPETRDIKWLYDNMKEGLLFIDDSFQRKYVWAERHKISLIESILLGYPIPEIYLWNTETNPDTGSTKYSIVDGQQRITSVFDFINGKFPLKTAGLSNNQDIDNKAYRNKSFSDLDGELKKSIWSYSFSIRFVNSSVSHDEIVKMFLRLNSTSISLNPQELRNAEFNGLFIQLASELADLEFWGKHNMFSNIDLRRMRDIQFVSSLLLFIRKGIEEETTQASMNRVFDLYNEKYDEAEDDKTIFVSVLDLISKFINSDKKVESLIKRRTHFYTLFTYIYFLIYEKPYEVEEAIKGYVDFAKHYIDEDLPFNNQNSEKIMNDYRQLSSEGVQRKSNRMERLQLLKSFIRSNI